MTKLVKKSGRIYATIAVKLLNAQQKADIKQVSSEFTGLFDSTLGVYPHRKFHIELEPGAKPKHVQPYPVPVIHLETFKKELMHLCEIKVLQLQGASEWFCSCLQKGIDTPL